MRVMIQVPKGYDLDQVADLYKKIPKRAREILAEKGAPVPEKIRAYDDFALWVVYFYNRRTLKEALIQAAEEGGYHYIIF